jgi:hypothetical protein
MSIADFWNEYTWSNNMSWERDPLLAKARLFFERAFEQPREDPLFGLWCSLALEMLARATVGSVSPTLLAEPDPNHKFLLQALNRGPEKGPRKSIGTVQVFALCRVLFPDFSEADMVAALALANRRNEELHSGNSAFAEYPPKYCLGGFYRICLLLTKSLGESLESVFGAEEARVAEKILAESQIEVKKRVLELIAAHRKVFLQKPESERLAAAENAKGEADKLAFKRHHRAVCPACQCAGTLQGEPFGPERASNEDGMIKVRQAVSPTSFSCSACGLRLEGYPQLEVAELGGQYTRATEYSPEDYFGLVNPENFDPSEYMEQYLSQLEAEAGAEWDNE